MKKYPVVFVVVLIVVSLPLMAAAMSHEKEGGHGQSIHEKMENSGGMMEGMMMLGNVDQDGVRAMAHIKAYDMAAMEKMQSMGMSATHHFMVMFVDIASGKPINDGMAAVKVQPEGGKASKTVKLMKMNDAYGADITVPAGKPVQITIGTKIKDEKKRQFLFEFAN